MSEPNISHFLLSLAPVRQMVANRVYPDKLPQGYKLPAIVYGRTGGQRQQMMCGTHGLVLGNYQLDIYGLTSKEVRDLSNRVIGSGRRGSTPPDAMLDYKGTMGGCDVKNCALATDFDSVDPEPGLQKRTQLWDIWYVERD